ncbi:MAG: rRNA ((1939)-C(5))-methyltransferase RlmD, partial [Bacillota bacterium]
FKIAAKSFFQVNPFQTDKLYARALSIANLTPTDVVLDAYSGVGTITLLAAKQAKHVTGVEIVRDAVLNAIENAKLNEIRNVSFIEADAAPYLVERAAKGKTYDVLFVDPPRNGCDEAFLRSVKVIKPKRFVYISCEPSSLARDIKYLSDTYEVKYVQPVDMFSQTYHVETVVLLNLKNEISKNA